MVCRSVARWQLMQPADFASASPTVWRSGAGGARRSPESPSAGARAAEAATRNRRELALMSEREQQVGEDRVQRAALARVVELLQAFPGKERRGGRVEHHVLAHEGPPLHAYGNVPADASRGRRLVAQHAQDLGVLEL